MKHFTDELSSGVSSTLNSQLPLNFYGVAAFTLNRFFQETVRSSVAAHCTHTGTSIRFRVPAVCDSMNDSEVIRSIESSINPPDMITSIGFEEIFLPEFQEKYIDKGLYTSNYLIDTQDCFRNAGFIDHRGIHTIFSVTPYVFLIDKKNLGDLPEPQTWQDLLKPCYYKKVIVNGSRSEFSYILLLYIYKEFGREGLEALANSITDCRHVAEISRDAGTGKLNGAAISVLPWFFAQCCPHLETTKVIWPTDGAITSPMSMIVRKDAVVRMKFLIDSITGKTFCHKAAALFCPVATVNVDNRLPTDATLKWLGWDYLWNNDMFALKKETRDIFMERWQ